MDEAIDAPTQDEAPEVTTEPEVEETQEHETDETQVEETSDEATETTETSQDEEPTTTEAEEVDEFVPEAVTAPTVAPPDIRSYVDADGNLDLPRYNEAQAKWMNDSMQAMLATTTKAAAMQSKYERSWNEAETKYPDLKKDRELRDMVQAIHANSATTGKYLSPTKAADKLFGVRTAAKSEGMRAAKESRTVQSAAALTTTNPKAPATQSSTKLNQLKEQMKTGTSVERKKASADYIQQLIDSGRL